MRSTIGIRKMIPGPLGLPSRRPRRKITPRSYSRRTLIDALSTTSTSTMTMKTTIRAAITALLSERSASSYGVLLGLRRARMANDEPQAIFDVLYDDVVARGERLAVGRARLPELAPHGYEAAAP